MAKKRNPILTAAQAESLIRYQPQLDGLRALMGQAQANYAGKVNEARAGQQAIQGSVSQVAPALHHLVGGLGLDASKRGVTLNQDVAGLGHVADSIKAAVALEGTGAANRLAQTDAFNMADLGNRYVQAAQGAVYAKHSARQALESDVGKISDQLQSVLGQKGAFTTATIEKLTNDAASRALTRRGQTLSAATQRRGQDISQGTAAASLTERQRHDKAMEDAAAAKAAAAAKKAAAAVKAGPKFTPKFRVKVQTAAAHATLRDGIDTAKSFAAQYQKTGTSRAVVEKWLTQGRSSQTVDVNGKKVHVPGIPKSRSPLAAQIALDLAYDGHISYAHAEELWRRGILLRGIGLRLPTGKGAQGATVAVGGGAGGVRPT